MWVTQMWTEGGVDIPNEAVDRAHRIGPSYTEKFECWMQECHGAFHYFPTQNSGYKAKKKMKPGVRVKLVLMKNTYTLLIDGSKVTKQNPDFKFCYADINCRLKIKWVDESIDNEFFSSMDDLQEILGNH